MMNLERSIKMIVVRFGLKPLVPRKTVMIIQSSTDK
jgi:hypothetical protein